MTKLPITVLVATKNEALNLPRCLSTLTKFARVVLLDSQSTDESAAIAAASGADVVQFRHAGGYPKKRQWALNELDISTPWVLLLDADESLPPQLVEEIRAAVSRKNAPEAFLITKGFHFMGRRFRFGGFSHAAVLLFRTGKAHFEQLIDDRSSGLDMEVHERLIVDGRIGRLKTPLVHCDDKGLAAYIERHNQYSTWEAQVRRRLLSSKNGSAGAMRASIFGNVQQRRRFLKLVAIRTPGEPLLWFLYHYVFRLGALEGWPGLIASRLRSQHVAHVRAKLYELEHGAASPRAE